MSTSSVPWSLVITDAASSGCRRTSQPLWMAVVFRLLRNPPTRWAVTLPLVSNQSEPWMRTRGSEDQSDWERVGPPCSAERADLTVLRYGPSAQHSRRTRGDRSKGPFGIRLQPFMKGSILEDSGQRPDFGRCLH